MPIPLSRRELVERCLSAGALALAPALPLSVAMPLLADEAAHPVTPHADLGPFYKRKAPKTTTLAPEDAVGVPLTVDGVVLDTRGELLQGAVLELWHASCAGLYDNDGTLYRASSKPARRAPTSSGPFSRATTSAASASTSTTW